MTVTVKPGPVKPLIKPKAPVAAAPAPAKPIPAPTTSKQVAETIKKLTQKPVQSIAPEDDPSAGGEAVGVDQNTGEVLFDTPAPAAPKPKAAKAAQVKGQTPTAHITTTNSSDGTTTDEQQVVGEDILIEGPAANVGVTCSITKNLGNYENVKVQVSLHLPCRLDADEIEETYKQCKEWVDEKIGEINEEIEAQKGD